ncbi:MAG: hypothetical protein QW100_04530 [Thermoplasmatales archaeon]
MKVTMIPVFQGGYDMPFVRWRGRCAQLIATVYKDGRSQKITLACLSGFYVSPNTKRYVAENFPGIKVDWVAVDRALAQGPPAILKTSTPSEHLDWATIENRLRTLAARADKENLAHEASCLYKAADILTGWRAHFYQGNDPGRRKH